MDTSSASQVILHNRSFLPGSPQRRLFYLLGLLLAGLTLLCAGLIYLIAQSSCSAAGCIDIAGLLWQRIREQPMLGPALVMAPVLAVFLVLLISGGRRRQRVILSDTYITYRSPYPGVLNFLQRDWSLQWIEVRRAWLAPVIHFAGPHLTALMLDTGGRRRKLMVYPWVDPEAYEPRTLRREARYMRELQSGLHGEAIRQSPLLRFIKDRVRFLEIQSPPASAQPFALEKHPWVLVVLIALCVLGAYAVMDTYFIVDEAYADGPFYAAYAAAGVLLALLTSSVLRARAVPRIEAAAMSVLLGAAFAFALYPGLLRLNALTDRDGFHTYSYHNQRPMQFQPAQSHLPTLHFASYPEYWSQFGEGDEYKFEIRRGGLHFYQVNMRPITSAMQKFYQSRKPAPQ